MRHMLAKCEHGVLICLATTNAKKSSLRCRYLNVPTWAKLGLWGMRVIFISSIILCVASIWKTPLVQRLYIFHSQVLLHLSKPIVKPFKLLFRINISNSSIFTHTFLLTFFINQYTRKIELLVYFYQASYQSGKIYSTTVNTAFSPHYLC